MNITKYAIVVFILLMGNEVFCQQNGWEIKAGLGLEQGLNIGLNKYYSKKANVGLGIGSHFPKKDSTHHLVVFAENNFNFPLKRTRTLKPYILLNQQVMFWKYSEPDFTHQAVTLALNIGFRLESHNEFGFILEVGPTVTYTVKFQQEPGSTVSPITNEIQENFRLLFFQRF